MQTPHILRNNIINTLGIIDGYKSNIGFLWYKYCKNMGFNVIGYNITKCGCSSLIHVH
jgi:hypothetical protein